MPGSWAVLRVDTRSEGHANAPPGERSMLLLSYLKSYERMGQARVECVAPCR